MVLQSILQVYTTHITAAEFLKELFYFICSKETIPHHRWWAALTSPAWRMWILFLPPDWLSTDRQTDRWRNLLMIISFEWFVSREGRGCLSQATEVISERQKFFFFLHTKKKRWCIFMLFASLAFRKTRIYLSVLLRVLFFLWRPKGF